ncbi:hypothetical protein [Streptomyces kronopolitis]|uniref:hypothetical protein n=1 Tax=Streptomyces kronopolitis TaxID=1612435 RepID=UPI0020BFD443|nr:hypothetical protein [Streptomyces kronopolitis]MCL6302928.1 hypothetical protein [Streptomyces kronopolitis]
MAFNRVQRKDTLSLLPNWRFFAPTPAKHDFHLLYRTLSQDGTTSPWKGLETTTRRRFRQIVWFPTRRQEKAIHDICSEILQGGGKGIDFVTNLPAYRVLLSYIERHMSSDAEGSVKGFQFTLARSAGYATSEEPKILLISPCIPVRSTAFKPVRIS